MKKQILFTLISIISLSGCTQLITAPISIAGTVVSASIDVASSVVRATIPDDDKE
jgi:hypothetical protein